MLASYIRRLIRENTIIFRETTWENSKKKGKKEIRVYIHKDTNHTISSDLQVGDTFRTIVAANTLVGEFLDRLLDVSIYIHVVSYILHIQLPVCLSLTRAPIKIPKDWYIS